MQVIEEKDLGRIYRFAKDSHKGHPAKVSRLAHDCYLAVFAAGNQRG